MPKKQSRRRQDNIETVRQKFESKLLDEKIKELQELAHSVKTEIQKKKKEDVQMEVGDLDKVVDPDDEDVSMLFNELMLEDRHDQLSLPTGSAGALLFNEPAKGINLPQAVLTKIGDSVRNIVVKDSQNWDSLVADLYTQRDGFKGLLTGDVDRFFKEIPVGSLNQHSLEILNTMLKEVRPDYNSHHYDFFMKHYAELANDTKTQGLFDQAVQSGIVPSKFMYGHLIKAFSKTHNLERINLTLSKMFDNHIEPSLKVYTNVLKLCVDLQDQQQAHEIFQMMKFRSIKSKPDVEAYNTMLQLASRKRDIHKALDLYREMLDQGLEPTIFTFNTLIQTCSKNKDHLIQGYNFISEIHKRNLEPNVKTFESMLRLAASDGDLELARALFLTIFEKHGKPTAGPEALNYLLMAYREFKPGHIPQISHHEDGAIIRRNTLRMVDFMGLYQRDVDDIEIQMKRERYPPMLPLRNVTYSKHIIAESNAIWAFNMVNDPRSLNVKLLISYLRIAVEHGDKKEFLRRYYQYTFPNEEIGKNELVLEQPDEDTPEKSSESSPPALSYLKQINFKVERNSEIYHTYLSAGKRFQDVDMCEQAWLERGRYRSTAEYQSLPKREKHRLDFKFAKEMVQSLTQLELYRDAVSVVKSSENQFPWDFYTLKPLYVALQQIGDDAGAREISAICGKGKGRAVY
jgi:pentatricopeptide repeat protein